MIHASRPADYLSIGVLVVEMDGRLNALVEHVDDDIFVGAVRPTPFVGESHS